MRRYESGDVMKRRPYDCLSCIDVMAQNRRHAWYSVSRWTAVCPDSKALEHPYSGRRGLFAFQHQFPETRLRTRGAFFHAQEKMMPPEAPHWTPTPLVVLLLSCWVISLTIVAGLIYLIAREFIRKADADDLPQILTALGPLVAALGTLLARVPGAAHLNAINPARQQTAVAPTDDGTTDDPGEGQA